MAKPAIVVIGASAGGFAALRKLTAALDPPLESPILVVLHVGAQPSQLPELLNAVGVTPAKHGEDGEAILPGRIYVAPPDRHMLVAGGRIRLTRGPKENWARPAIDPLFRSAAQAYGRSAIGVILTGHLNDGSAGLYEIKQRGGVAIAQDPRDAANPEMPASAARHVRLDYCPSLSELPSLLQKLVTGKETAVTIDAAKAAAPARPEMINGEEFDRPITVTCPDCGGALRRSEVGTIVKYACHIGHLYTAEAMAAAQFNEMERVMRAAERILNERSEFCRQMADRADPRAEVWRSASAEALERAYTLRDFVEQEWITPQAAPPASTGLAGRSVEAPVA